MQFYYSSPERAGSEPPVSLPLLAVLSEHTSKAAPIDWVADSLSTAE
jgi:hypothetical protein